MWNEANLAALCGRDLASPDAELARTAHDARSMAVWAWWRVRHGGGAACHPALTEVARTLAARDALAAVRLQSVVDAFGDDGIPSLLLKGAALSYGPYPEPWMRSRLDDDVLVARRDFARASGRLRALGYQSRPQNPGPDVLGQAHFTRIFETGDRHHVDLHWRPFVPAAFQAVPGIDELLKRSVAIAALGRHARGPSAPDALLLGIVHRVAHHGGDDDAMWVIDAHVLASTLDEVQWDAFSSLARRAGMARVAAAELTRARDALGTTVPQTVLRDLAATTGEASAAHLRAPGRLHRWLIEMRQHPEGAWPTFRARAFPDAEYMRHRYGVPPALLPAAYLWRTLAGGGQWVLEAARRRLGGR